MRTLVLALALAVAAPWSAGQEPGPAGERDLARWVEALGHEDFAVREEAADLLRKAGAGARTALEAAKDSENAEQRTRVRQLLKEMELDRGGPQQEPLKPAQPPEVRRPRGSIRLDGAGADPFEALRDLDRRMAELREWMDRQSEELSRLRDLPDLKELFEGLDLKMEVPEGAAGVMQVEMHGPDGKLGYSRKADGSVRIEDGDAVYEFGSLDEFKTAHPDVHARLSERGLFPASGVRPGGFPGIVFGGRFPAVQGFGSPWIPRPPPGIEPVPAPRGRTLGVVLNEVPRLLRTHMQIPASAQLVESVHRGSPADRAGIQASDILLEVDGHPASDPEAVREALNRANGRDDAVVKILSGGVEKTVTVRWPSLR